MRHASAIAALAVFALVRCDDLPARQKTTFGAGKILRRNPHPTVKPVKLMRLLVHLACPAGGTVLDLFMGSGTTGMACMYEGREFIGIERDAAYVEIAKRRIAHAQRLSGMIGDRPSDSPTHRRSYA